MIKKICDRCKKEVEEINVVGILIARFPHHYQSYHLPEKVIHWCDKCLAEYELGVYKYKCPDPPKLLEDIIKAWIEEAVDDRD